MVEWAIYADFIRFYSPTQLCGGGTTKSNSNELPISVLLSFKTEKRREVSRLFYSALVYEVQQCQEAFWIK